MTSNILESFDKKYNELIEKYRIVTVTRENIGRYIDHTLLKPEATSGEIKKLCDEARKYNFKAVCVNPYNVKQAAKELKNNETEIASVIGFPLGATPMDNKISEAKRAIDDGATEIDMVINIGALKEGKINIVKNEIEGVVSCGVVTKVIIEICLLADKEKILITEIVRDAGAAFVKTSTGFGKSGATIRDVALLKYVAGESLKVKAAGGIRDFETARAMIFAGADRIGASRSVSIVSGS